MHFIFGQILLLLFLILFYFIFQGKFEFLEENRDDDLCYYLFTIASSQVCGNSITVGDVILIL